MSETRQVTKEEFFAAIGRMNVHPRPERDASYWETPDRRLIGKTTPGYMGVSERRYELMHERKAQ